MVSQLFVVVGKKKKEEDEQEEEEESEEEWEEDATEHMQPMSLKLFSERFVDPKSRNFVSSFNQVFHWYSFTAFLLIKNTSQ